MSCLAPNPVLGRELVTEVLQQGLAWMMTQISKSDYTDWSHLRSIREISLWESV